MWRQNNLAVRGRKFTGMPGLPDIIGHASDGKAVYCEVKTERDRLSDAQLAFLDEAHASSCWAFIAYQRKGAIYLKTWADYRMAGGDDTA